MIKLSVEGEDRESDEGDPVCCSLWEVFVFALPCPLLKMLHTLVTRTQFLHVTAVASALRAEEGKQSVRRVEQSGRAMLWDLWCFRVTYVSFLALL